MLHSLGSHAKELKQQGAVEAAQDERKGVAAQDAEKVLVEESIKGGAAAFQFDPDASPQEKAAQAEAVSIFVIHSNSTVVDLLFHSKFLPAFIARKSPESASQPILYVPAVRSHQLENATKEANRTMVYPANMIFPHQAETAPCPLLLHWRTKSRCKQMEHQ